MGVRLELTRYPPGRSEDDAEGCRPVGLKGEPTEDDDPPGTTSGSVSGGLLLLGVAGYGNGRQPSAESLAFT